MQTNTISKFFRNVLAALVAFIGCVSIAPTNAQQSPGAQAPAVTLPMKVDSDVSGISLELTSVQKTGDTITIRFKYINSRDQPVRIDRETNQQVSDMYYVDAKNKKKYPIVKDTQGNPLSSNLQYLEVGAGETKAGWAKFPAPPSDVAIISVYIPGAPPFENVPIAQ